MCLGLIFWGTDSMRRFEFRVVWYSTANIPESGRILIFSYEKKRNPQLFMPNPKSPPKSPCICAQLQRSVAVVDTIAAVAAHRFVVATPSRPRPLRRRQISPGENNYKIKRRKRSSSDDDTDDYRVPPAAKRLASAFLPDASTYRSAWIRTPQNRKGRIQFSVRLELKKKKEIVIAD